MADIDVALIDASNEEKEDSSLSEIGELEEIEGEGSRKSLKETISELTHYDEVWKGDFGEEYGEGGTIVLPHGEEELAYPPFMGEAYEYEPSESVSPSISTLTEEEETEEERIARQERERIIDLIRCKLIERVGLKRRNMYLHRKLVEHFKKRRMDHVFKEDPKGLDLENKYLKRLYLYHEFKDNQEAETAELTKTTAEFKVVTDDLESELDETLNKFIQRQKEVSIGLVLSKSGKKVNEKMIDRLLRRQVQKCLEKGKLKLKYVKLKNLIEEKDKQLKKMENFGDGLHIMDYEQLKIDNQNYTDKIEEKEEELSKLRVKTHGNIQNLAQVREKGYAIEGDIELMENKFFEVESEFNATREKVGRAKKKRDNLREEFARLKRTSGLLTNDRLLKDFENSIDEKERVEDILDEMRFLMKEKRRKHAEMAAASRNTLVGKF